MHQVEEYRVKFEKALYEKNSVTNVLALLEEKTGVKRLYIAYGLIAFLGLYLIVGYGAQFLANFIGFVYPAYCSVKAIESVQKDDDTKWLTYWVVYAFFSLLEYFTDIFLFWIPIYAFLKCLFLIYCFIPTKWNGSLTIYNRVIKPLVLRHQKQVDAALDRAADVAGDFMDETYRFDIARGMCVLGIISGLFSILIHLLFLALKPLRTWIVCLAELSCQLAADSTQQIENQSNNILDECAALELAPLVPNAEPFECPIEFEDVPKGAGITLRLCGHMVCKPCLKKYIEDDVIIADGDILRGIKTPPISCPCVCKKALKDGEIPCEGFLEDREICAIVSPEAYKQFTDLCHIMAAAKMQQLHLADPTKPRPFFCRTEDCIGCIMHYKYDEKYVCAICKKTNCIKCGAIHEGMTCSAYQSSQKYMDFVRNERSIEENIKLGKEMRCPGCRSPIIKKGGCNLVICRRCRTHMCWGVKGPRWGPNGVGDTSGGCHCDRKNEKPCIEGCWYC